MQLKSHTASLFSTSSLITVTPTIRNMAQLQMTRELVRLEVDLASVDINNSYATHSKLRNESQISDTAEENNLPPTQTSNNTHGDEEATPSNLCSPLRNSSELVTISNASQNPTRM